MTKMIIKIFGLASIYKITLKCTLYVLLKTLNNKSKIYVPYLLTAQSTEVLIPHSFTPLFLSTIYSL